MFPSPCGVWVVSARLGAEPWGKPVSVPLRGVGCFQWGGAPYTAETQCFRPLAGCGLFLLWAVVGLAGIGFRPLAGCGLFPRRRWMPWASHVFPSPCGVWVVSVRALPPPRAIRGFRPLAGCGLFRPRSATGSMPSRFPSPCGVWVVSVRALPPPRAIRGFRPLAGCGCFRALLHPVPYRRGISVPLRGVGCFWSEDVTIYHSIVSVPLRGVGCFDFPEYKLQGFWFPSPCGVWVVSQQLACRGAGQGFRPLAGCGLFPVLMQRFVIPGGFRPLAGCGLFRQSCTFFLVQQEKELSTLLFYCIILADVYQ